LLYKFTMQRTWARVPQAPEIGQFSKISAHTHLKDQKI
jgi:hypothetical protein